MTIMIYNYCPTELVKLSKHSGTYPKLLLVKQEAEAELYQA